MKSYLVSTILAASLLAGCNNAPCPPVAQPKVTKKKVAKEKQVAKQETLDNLMCAQDNLPESWDLQVDVAYVRSPNEFIDLKRFGTLLGTANAYSPDGQVLVAVYGDKIDKDGQHCLRVNATLNYRDTNLRSVGLTPGARNREALQRYLREHGQEYVLRDSTWMPSE
jgi:hypothetical protein